MKLLSALGGAAVLFVAVLLPATAAPLPLRQTTSSHTVMRTFRLQMTRSVDPAATFWVAYGPLAGHFGIVELRRAGPGLYQANRRLPARGQTIFSYLEGRGLIHTRLGPAPGSPVVTITRVGPVSASSRALDLVTWQPPVG